MKYKDIVKVNEAFQYSINLQFDINSINKITEYIPTNDSCDVLEHYIDSINGNFTKATTLIGPYGKGKSHLLLVLLTLLNDYTNEDKDVIDKLLSKIKNINEGLFEKIYSIRKNRLKYLPVIINSNYNDLNQAFLLALTEALERENIDEIVIDTYFSIALKIINKWEDSDKEVISKFNVCLKEYGITINKLKLKLKQFDNEGYKVFKNVYSCVMHGMEFNPLINTDIIKYYKDINYKLCEKGYNGMIIVFDEFSKFLEYANNENMMKDLKILQDFAELAARSGKKEQILLSCITHKTINEYMKNIKEDKINAFKTVEGRFKEILFNKSIEQNYDIISQTLIKGTEFEKKYHEFYSNNSRFYESIMDNKLFQVDKIENVLFKGCYPINPITVYALIQISEKIAQNERTLFTFLTDDDPNGFKYFLNNNEKGLFNVDKIYDYFSSILRKDTDETIKNNWIKAQNAMNKVITELEEKIVKVICIINILNEENFETNEKNISLCLNVNQEEISNSINKMIGEGIIKYKKLSQTYDFSSVYNVEAIKEIEKLINTKFNKINYRSTMEKIVDLGFVIPRRYNQEFKMTRFFKNIFLTADEFSKLKSFKLLLDESKSDGIIINILKQSDEENLDIYIQNCKDDRVIVKECKEDLNKDIWKMMKEYEAIQYLKNSFSNETEMLNEINAMEQDITEYIEKSIEKQYGNISNCYVYYNGIKEKKLSNLNGLVSDICKNIYSKTPIINNEMINKNIISTPINKARSIVIETVLERNPYLIKSETSAEATIYNAIVMKQDNDDVKRIINMITDYIKGANEKITFEKLLQKLYNKPYGMRKGLIPVFLSMAINDLIDNLILYYQSKEIDINAENISKIIESPDKYFIMLEKGTKDKIDFIKSLSDIFESEYKDNQRQNVKELIGTIKRWILSMPRIIREMNITNNIITKSEYIEFKNYLLRNDINSNEFLFIKTKDIFKMDNYLKIVEEVKTLKQGYDTYLNAFVDDLVLKIKRVLRNEIQTSLNNVLKDWLKTIKDKTVNTIISVKAKKLIEYVEQIDTYNEYEIVENLSLNILGYYIEDWQDNTNDIFLNELSEIFNELQNLENQNLESDSETVEIINGNEKIKKMINVPEISQIGNTMKNNIEDVLAEYGESISESEKIKILLDLVKKYM